VQAIARSILEGKSMQRLRKLIAGAFCVIPFIYGIVAVSIPPLIFRLLQDSSDYAYQDGGLNPPQVAMLWVTRILLCLIALGPVTIFIASIGAAIQFFRGKQNARAWAIACGIAFLVASVPSFSASALVDYYSGGSSNGWLEISSLGFIHLAAGVLILVAFLPRSAASQPVFQSARVARVKGDGTTALSLYLAIAVVFGGCFYGDTLSGRWAANAQLPPPDSSLLHTNLILFAALVLSITFHELGHMAAGRAVGMKILSFRIGPVQAALDDGKWRLIPPRSLGHALGAGVSMIPANPLNYDRRQLIVGGAGGTLANLFIGSITLVGLVTAKGSPYQSWWYFLSQMAILNFAFFVVNLIPVKEAAMYSDGARIFQIVTGSVLEDYRRILAMTQATTVTPLRPRDYKIHLVEKVIASDTPGIDRTFLLLVAGDYYFDIGDMESARQKFREAEELYDREASFSAEHCGYFVSRAVYLLADAAMAEKWWQRKLTAKRFKTGRETLFPACAYFLIIGRLREAEEAWQAEFEHANRLPETGEREFDLYNLGYLRKLIDQAARQAKGEIQAPEARQVN
jgi:Zn-dependent protease